MRRGREFEEDLGIRGAAGRLLETGAVADGLSQIGELAFDPPSQGTEPDDGGVEAGKGLKKKSPWRMWERS